MLFEEELIFPGLSVRLGGQASSLSIGNDGQDARRHRIIFFRHYF